MPSNTQIVVIVLICTISAAVSWLRDTGYGGPHHDEAISMLASNALEQDYSVIKSKNLPPLDKIVKAADWHAMTHFSQPASFFDIREDVLKNDKHPPLAFWLFNRWLSLFENGGYEQARILTWLQIVLAGGLLSIAVFRQTRSPWLAVCSLALFLIGNSAVFTGIWIRQYALLAIFYAAVILLSAEIVRTNLSIRMRLVISIGLAGICLGGMMTAYTFATASAPIHLCALLVLAARRQWKATGILLACYAAVGVLFFLLLPDVLLYVFKTSEHLNRPWQLFLSLRGISRMYIPVPASLSGMPRSAIGFLGLLLPFLAAGWVWNLRGKQETDLPDARIPLCGMLGAGLLQFVLVTLGFFPAWGTGPNHLCPFWLLTVYAAVTLLTYQPKKMRSVIMALMLGGLLGMQVLFAWHCHRILPRVNTSYIASQQPDLVVIDELSRGNVLQVTDVMEPDQLVLASPDLTTHFYSGTLLQYPKILYLPIHTSIQERKSRVMQAAVEGGFGGRALPVVHPGSFEAILFQRKKVQ